MREMFSACLDFIRRAYREDHSLLTVLGRISIILDELYAIKDQAELLANAVLNPESDITTPENRAQFILEKLAEIRSKWYI